MTPVQLRESIRGKFGLDVFMREETRQGKRIVECGRIVPRTAKQKGYTKSITFNAAVIPDDALDKIAMVIE